MEPFEHDELSPRELDEVLQEWTAPAPPAHLRAAIFGEPRPSWWKSLWTQSIRVPLPVACCLALLFAAAVWRMSQPAPATSHRLTFEELRPVNELHVRIIRSGNARN